MHSLPRAGPEGARAITKHRRPLAKLHIPSALRLRACRADRRVEPADGAGGKQSGPGGHAGDLSLSCFTRPVTRPAVVRAKSYPWRCSHIASTTKRGGSGMDRATDMQPQQRRAPGESRITWEMEMRMMLRF